MAGLTSRQGTGRRGRRLELDADHGITRTEFEKRMRETLRPLGYVVQVESERLARLVTQKNELKINAPLAYCFREVIRNVFEHADADRCAVCAQKGSDGYVEIAIVDSGRGIRRSLQEKHPVSSDREALELALRPESAAASPLIPTTRGQIPVSAYMFSLSLAKHWVPFALLAATRCSRSRGTETLLKARR